MSIIIILNHQRLQLVVLKTHHYENYQKKCAKQAQESEDFDEKEFKVKTTNIKND